MGDFNINLKTPDKKRFVTVEIGSEFKQLVKDATRVKARSVNGSTEVSQTLIDLVFVPNDLKVKIKERPQIIKDSPSDHYFISSKFELLVPSKYVVKEYYLDTTRRRPIPRSKLSLANSEMANLIDTNRNAFLEANNHDSLVFAFESNDSNS